MTDDDITRWATAPMAIDQLRHEVMELRAFRDAVAGTLGHPPSEQISTTDLMAQLGRDLYPGHDELAANHARMAEQLADARRDLETMRLALPVKVGMAEGAYSYLVHRLTLLASEFDATAGRTAGPDGSCAAQISTAWEIAARSLRNVLGVG